MTCNNYGLRPCTALPSVRWSAAINAANSADTAPQRSTVSELYQVQRDIDGKTGSSERLAHRRSRSAPVAKVLHDRLLTNRAKVPGSTATAKAIDGSLNRWAALTRFLDDPRRLIDNNHDEQQSAPGQPGARGEN